MAIRMNGNELIYEEQKKKKKHLSRPKLKSKQRFALRFKSGKMVTGGSHFSGDGFRAL